jgi:glycine hydroxymethyltransferase
MHDLEHVLDLTRRHNAYLRDRIDLVASNSWISSWARLTMSSLLSNSYCIGLPGNRLYGGCDYIDMVEREVLRLATELFGTRYGVVQFLSGMQANIGAYNAILQPGDTIVTAPGKHGGHYSHNEAGPLRFFSPRILPVPFDARTYNIDVDRLDALLAKEHPKLLVVGWSEFLFPHPLAAIREVCNRHGTKLMYDMSHVAGLLAGGKFQHEAGALADIVTSSTGKSLHAPDHGLCLYNDDGLTKGVLDAVMPLLTSNTHPHELAALGIALAEMQEFGADYAAQVVKNTKALARALAARGIKALYADLDFSESHTVLVEYARADFAVNVLDVAGVSVNACALPWDEGARVTGLRIGTQVVTRRGMKEPEMDRIADAVARVLLHGEDPLVVRHAHVAPLAREFQSVAYSFDGSFPLASDWQEAPYRKGVPADAASLALCIPAFHDLPVSAVKELAAEVAVSTAPPGARVLTRGEASDAVYFVANGALEVLGADDATVIADIGEGDHVGEFGVLKGRARGNHVVVAAGTPAVLLRVEGHAFKALLARHAPVASYFERHLARLESASA